TRELYGLVHAQHRPRDRERVQPFDRGAEELPDHGAVGGPVAVPDHRDLSDPGDPGVGLHPHDPEAPLLGESERALEGSAAADENGGGTDPRDPARPGLTHTRSFGTGGATVTYGLGEGQAGGRGPGPGLAQPRPHPHGPAPGRR